MNIKITNLKYKIHVFLNLEFCIMTLLVMICFFFLLLSITTIDKPIRYINFIYDNAIISIITSYIISYIFYFLTYHIPNFKQNIINEKIMCEYLTDYKRQLIYAFGALAYKLKKENNIDIKDIPEITALFKSDATKDKYIVSLLKNINNYNFFLQNQFYQIINDFKQLLIFNALYKSRFTEDIIFLKTNNWMETISIINSDIKLNIKPITDTLNKEKNIINKAFEITNKACHIYDYHNNLQQNQMIINYKKHSTKTNNE